MARKLYSPQDAAARYATLPEEIKSLIYSSEMLMLIRQIAQKHQLHIDQTGILEDETSAVMLGFIKSDEYPKVLSETLNVSEVQANAIAADVEELLFTKIRSAMQKIYEATKVEPKIVGSGVEPKPSLATALPITIKTETPPAPTPVPAPVMPVPLPAVIPKPAEAPKMPPAPAPVMPVVPAAPASTTPHPDQILSEPTVSKAPATPTPAAPKSYTADPYREPPIP